MLLKCNTLHFVLATVSQRLAYAFHSDYFLVSDWSERQEIGLLMAINCPITGVQ